jgi:hypothetical protein
MGVYKFSEAGTFVEPRTLYKSMLAGNEAFTIPGDYELIESAILTSSQSSVTFDNLGDYAFTYKHLQIRATYRSGNTAGGFLDGTFRLNGDTGSNYSYHNLYTTDGPVKSEGGANTTSMRYWVPALNGQSNHYAAGVFDILDAYSTTKNKTLRLFTGNMASTTFYFHFVNLFSGNWRNTASTTSITMATPDNFIAGSRFSLYGIKG